MRFLLLAVLWLALLLPAWWWAARWVAAPAIWLAGTVMQQLFSWVQSWEQDGVTAIIQAREGYADAIDMSNEKAAALYDEVLRETKELMLRKNHDYGEAWREMSKEGIVDMILAKIIRIKTILSNDGKTISSEGVEGNYFDIINYAIFDLIHYES